MFNPVVPVQNEEEKALRRPSVSRALKERFTAEKSTSLPLSPLLFLIQVGCEVQANCLLLRTFPFLYLKSSCATGLKSYQDITASN